MCTRCTVHTVEVLPCATVLYSLSCCQVSVVLYTFVLVSLSCCQVPVVLCTFVLVSLSCCHVPVVLYTCGTSLPQLLPCASCPVHMSHISPSGTDMSQLSCTHVAHLSFMYCHVPVVLYTCCPILCQLLPWASCLLSACCARLPELLPCASCPVCMMCQSLSATTTYVLVVL